MFGELFETAFQNLLFFALHLDGGYFPKQFTKKEEQECIARIAKGDPEARNELIEHNLRLVVFIVNKHYGDSKEQEDLISIGTIGLIRAAETFNPEKAISFLSCRFASSTIPAPSILPIIIAIADPSDIYTTLNRLNTVEEIFCAATTSRPRVE